MYRRWFSLFMSRLSLGDRPQLPVVFGRRRAPYFGTPKSGTASSMSSSASQCAKTLAAPSSGEELAVPIPRKDKQSSEPLLTASQDQDSLDYVAALVDGRGPAGVDG
jgi:hypothetical protein